MSATCTEQQQTHQTKQSDETDVETFRNDLEFDCPECIDFKDPNVDASKFNENQENDTNKLVRTQTRTKLYKTVEKKITLSPISKKKKQFKPVTYNNKKPIINVNERLYRAAQRRQPTYKTLAELVKDFDKVTRVYEDESDKVFKRPIIHPRSPKLLSKNRNRVRTALSQLEQDELIARTIKKNTFKAQPIKKKLFDSDATGIPKVQFTRSAVKNHDSDFHSARRLGEIRKEKIQAVQKSIDNVNFVFKAKPMPVFRKVPIMMRNNQLIKRQTSEQTLNQHFKKMTNTIVKQNSDSTLTRIAQTDLVNDGQTSETEAAVKSCDNQCVNEYKCNVEGEHIMSDLINGNLATEEEAENDDVDFKSLNNFENSRESDESVETDQ